MNEVEKDNTRCLDGHPKDLYRVSLKHVKNLSSCAKMSANYALPVLDITVFQRLRSAAREYRTKQNAASEGVSTRKETLCISMEHCRSFFDIS